PVLLAVLPPRRLPPFPTRRSSDLGQEFVPVADDDVYHTKCRPDCQHLFGNFFRFFLLFSPRAPKGRKSRDFRPFDDAAAQADGADRRSTRLNSSHVSISYAGARLD